MRSRVRVKCKECMYTYDVCANSLYMGHGCPKCAGLKHKTHKEFVSEIASISPSIEILGEYKNSCTKIECRCKICGRVWHTTPNSLLNGRSCARCAGTLKKTHEEFVMQMKERHPSVVVLDKYQNNRVKLRCKCLRCGEVFLGIPHAMVDSLHGCPHCISSKGEKVIRSWLTHRGIQYYSEHCFKDCRDKNPLPFDFYIPKYNTVIEYDGAQHFAPNEFFGGKAAFETTRRHDRLKDEYCSKYNIRLIRIPHWKFDDIDSILSNQLVS